MACLTKSDGQVRLAILYKAKIYRKTLGAELKARSAQNINLTLLYFEIFEDWKTNLKDACE